MTSPLTYVGDSLVPMPADGEGTKPKKPASRRKELAIDESERTALVGIRDVLTTRPFPIRQFRIK